jgi:hypothetical protein
MPDRCARIVALALAVSLVPLAFARAAPLQEDEEEDSVGIAGTLVEKEKLVEVSGTIAIEDGNGGAVNDASGTIVLGVHGIGVRRQYVPFDRGRWKALVPAGCRLSFDLFKLDGGTARWVVEDDASAPSPEKRGAFEGLRVPTIAIPTDRRLAIRVRRVPPTRLHVVDAATGKELEHVLVLDDLFHDIGRRTRGAARGPGPRPIHPLKWWKTNERVGDASSPISLTANCESGLPMTRWSDELWVHAPGYCWAGVTLDPATGGDATVRLSPGGTLTVNVAGAAMPSATRIVLRRSRVETSVAGKEPDETGDGKVDGSGTDENRCAEWPLESGRSVTFDALPPGDYLVSVELGERVEEHSSLAKTEVSIAAGINTTTTLDAKSVPTIRRTSQLRGLLQIDPGWADTPFFVRIRPLDNSAELPEDLLIRRDELERVPAPAALWRLPPRRLPPGSYWLTIEEFGVARPLVLPRDEFLAVEIGPPVVATFHFVDAKTNAPLAVTPPYWVHHDRYWPAEDSVGGRMVPIVLSLFRDIDQLGVSFPEFASPTHSLRVPAGRISIAARAEDYDPLSSVDVEMTREKSDVTVPLRHLTGVRIQFLADGKAIDAELVEKEAREVRPEKDDFDFELKLRSHRPEDAAKDAPTFSGQSHGGFFVAVETPGEYTLVLPSIDGFEPFAPRDVSVVDQEFTEVVYDLVRKKK